MHRTCIKRMYITSTQKSITTKGYSKRALKNVYRVVVGNNSFLHDECSSDHSRRCRLLVHQEMLHFAHTIYLRYTNNSHINSLKTEHRLLYLKTQFVPRSKHFHICYKNQSVSFIFSRRRCLLCDIYETNKYSVGIPGIPRKIVSLIKMSLTETYSRVRVGKNVSDGSLLGMVWNRETPYHQCFLTLL